MCSSFIDEYYIKLPVDKNGRVFHKGVKFQVGEHSGVHTVKTLIYDGRWRISDNDYLSYPAESCKVVADIENILRKFSNVCKNGDVTDEQIRNFADTITLAVKENA